MLHHEMFRAPEKGQSRVLAAFSYRYDAHLVPEFMENIRPGIHGYVAWDDRNAGAALSDEPTRRATLFNAARDLGADWLLTPDPDERLERGFSNWLPDLVARGDRIVWNFTLREMFSATHVRIDGPWGGKSKVIFFPIAAARVDPQALLHAPHVGDGAGFIQRNSGIIAYHLRMASPARRQLRRDLYAAADPDRRFQTIGYDYLADERGMVLEPLAPGRNFTPPFSDDHGLWSPDPKALGATPPDPFEVRLHRAARSAVRCGQLAAHHVLADLADASPEDGDLHLLSASFAQDAGDSAVAARLATACLARRPGDLYAQLLLTKADPAANDAAANDPAALATAVPGSPVMAALLANAARPTADFAAPTVAWHADAPGDAVLHQGPGVAQSDLATVVHGFRSQPGLLSAVRSLLNQDQPTEIVVVNSGGGSVVQDLAPVADRIRLITCDTPLFVGAARNIGIAASRAPFIAFLAGDCLARPGWVSGRLARHRAGALAVSTAVVPARDGLIPLAANLLRYSMRNPLADPRFVTDYGQSYARRLLSLCGQFPPGLRVGEDTALNLIAARFARPVWAPEVQTAHHDPDRLADWLVDERLRGQRRARHAPFRALAAVNDHALAVAPIFDQRRANLRAFIDRMPGLSPATRRSVLAMQWLASQADRRGVLEALAQLAEADGLADPTKVGTAWAADPDDPAKAHRAGVAQRIAGDVSGAEAAFRAALALQPAHSDAAAALLDLVSSRDGPVAAWQLAERLAIRAPTAWRLWFLAGERALAAGQPAWAVALGQIGLGGAVATPQAHARLARLHGAAGNPLGQAFRTHTASRLRNAATRASRDG